MQFLLCGQHRPRQGRRSQLLVGLVEGIHAQEDGPNGEDVVGDDGHETNLDKRGWEREVEHHVGQVDVLHRRLQTDGHNLGSAWKMFLSTT